MHRGGRSSVLICILLLGMAACAIAEETSILDEQHAVFSQSILGATRTEYHQTHKRWLRRGYHPVVPNHMSTSSAQFTGSTRL